MGVFKMKKNKGKRGIFTIVVLYSIAVCVVSTLIAVASGVFLYGVSTYLTEQNFSQKKEFDASKVVLDTVDERYVEQFNANKTEELKTKLAQQGLTSLLDTAHIHVLYGYDEIENILANQTSEPKGVAVANPKGYNWPGIRLISMVYDTSKCTTMVEFTGGDNKDEQKRQVWKWEHKGGKWIPLAFSNYFVPNDVEISRQGISFMLSPKHDTKLAKLFVLKK
jgi:hypothetical protein